MRILFHLNSMGRGGAERVVSVLSHYFAKAGYEVIVATQWYSENEYVLDERVRRLSVGLTSKEERRGRAYQAFARLFHLRACIRRERPDVVISFCAKANFRSAYALTGMRIPLIVSVRNDPQTDYAPHGRAMRYMERKAAGCVFQTPTAQSFFSQAFQERSRIIFNPLSEVYYEEQPIVTVRRKAIVNVGRISAQKNQLMLVHAFEKIAEKYPDYVLELYGGVQDEAIMQQLQDDIRAHNMQERVHFMGTTDTIQNAIRDASLFVLSSDFEGMPNALLEAMALGLPCISTDCPCGGSALLIQDGISGVLVPVGDADALSAAMDELLSDNARAASMSAQAQQIKEQVHPERIAREWMEYIDRVTR